MTFIDARWQIHFVTDRPQEGGHLACKRAIAWKAQVRLCARYRNRCRNQGLAFARCH
jgi:hypothetical protein